MRARSDLTAASGPVFTVLAQRASGEFRASIRRASPDSGDLVMTLERFDADTRSYLPLAVFKPKEYFDAVTVLWNLMDATEEASRALNLEERMLRGGTQ